MKSFPYFWSVNFAYNTPATGGGFCIPTPRSLIVPGTNIVIIPITANFFAGNFN